MFLRQAGLNGNLFVIESVRVGMTGSGRRIDPVPNKPDRRRDVPYIGVFLTESLLAPVAGGRRRPQPMGASERLR